MLPLTWHDLQINGGVHKKKVREGFEQRRFLWPPPGAAAHVSPLCPHAPLAQDLHCLCAKVRLLFELTVESRKDDLVGRRRNKVRNPDAGQA